jgi:hypothetical protein
MAVTYFTQAATLAQTAAAAQAMVEVQRSEAVRAHLSRQVFPQPVLVVWPLFSVATVATAHRQQQQQAQAVMLSWPPAQQERSPQVADPT